MNDLWVFNLDTHQWDSIPQGDIKPLPRFGHTAVYIPLLDKMIIFGGQGTSSLFDETWEYSGISSVVTIIDTEIQPALFLKASCNPCSNSSTISFSIPENSQVSLTITDVTGKIVSVPVNEQLMAGIHSVYLDDYKFNSGVYFCSLKSNKFSKLIRLIITASH